MGKKLDRYTVEVGDDEFYFSFGKTLTETQVLKICERRLKGLQSEIFPGLRLKSQGQVLQPRLQVTFVPVDA